MLVSTSVNFDTDGDAVTGWPVNDLVIDTVSFNIWDDKIVVDEGDFAEWFVLVDCWDKVILGSSDCRMRVFDPVMRVLFFNWSVDISDDVSEDVCLVEGSMVEWVDGESEEDVSVKAAKVTGIVDSFKLEHGLAGTWLDVIVVVVGRVVTKFVSFLVLAVAVVCPVVDGILLKSSTGHITEDVTVTVVESNDILVASVG